MDKQSRYTDLIKAKISKYANKSISKEVGKVISISDGIAIVSGLDDIMLNEVVTFDNGTQGLALNLESGIVGIILLGAYDDIKENSIVYRTNSVISIPVGDELLGRVVSPLGKVIDGKPKLNSSKTMPIEKIAPGVMTRKPVDAPIETGYLAIDSMFPIGKGQRELIVGDRQTGKTTLAIDTIINQKGKNVRCVYVCIGQKNSSLARIIRNLQSHDSMEYTTIVSASASSLPAEMYLAPYAGVTIAEE
jgi:F-type H+-transporting ATPase subunit alpha